MIEQRNKDNKATVDGRNPAPALKLFKILV